VDYNIFYVKNLEIPQATTVISMKLTWIQDNHANATENVSAHEVGHLLGISYESNNSDDVMYNTGVASNPTSIKRQDWRTVNQ